MHRPMELARDLENVGIGAEQERGNQWQSSEKWR